MQATLLAVALYCALAPGAVAQARPVVRVELEEEEIPTARVSLHGLLDDDRFLSAMESGFPLYLEYRVELREARSLWDRTVAAVDWQFVVLYDPVRRRYRLEYHDGTDYLPDVTALSQRLEDVYRIHELQPDRPGEYYFAAVVNATTLTDEDVDEVFAWLRGEGADSLRRDRPGFVTRTARKLLVRVAPLPRMQIEGKSDKFEHREP
ncbi:MAG: DUF4390 domain-containing protein [Gemmatimonadota bacterium]|nr:MAG: DUF4390 domain-containing protein [Gemmatimonadota bacterium]